MPSTTFASLGVPEDLVDVLNKQGIEEPFPIQAATLRDGLAGRDVSGRAPTGSGKTLAFGLVIADKTHKARPKRPTALVLVPTRELAAQVAAVIDPLARRRNQSVATVYGGTGYGPQRNALNRGVDVLVACPGRLEDLMEQRALVLSDVKICVVDEADRMADMGFLPAVKRILDKCAQDRQTLLFSATLDGDVDVLVRRYQRDPVRHEVATSEEEQGDVGHHFWRAERDDRVKLVAHLIGTHSPAIVFVRTRHGADRLAKQLGQNGIEAAPIHGSRSQPQRDRALAAFQAGRVSALVATDVAARGIHVDDVSCVIHYDPPTTHKDYVHRSGRTGRAGANGTVVSLVGRENMADVRAIQRALKMPHRVDRPDLTLVNPHVPSKPRPVLVNTAPFVAEATPENRHRIKSPRTNGHRGQGGPRRRRPQDGRRPARRPS